jgi:CheY-like chemotaxis protein/anti-sigma regulatory factor (Ser/Thr protein kinase)
VLRTPFIFSFLHGVVPMETVLVVDDSAVDRRLAGGLLTKLPQLRVEYASSGTEAIQRIEEILPSLVIADLVMPGCSGLELVEQVTLRFPQIPVILMTNKGSEDIAVQALKAGAANYVPKVSLADRLGETVLNLLSLAQQRRSQAQLMASLVRSDYLFDIGIDDELIAPLISHLQASMCDVGIVDESSAIRVCIALEEAIRNAMFHGNLEITSEQREGDSDAYARLLTLRRNSAPYNKRHLQITFRLSPQEAVFIIRDDGPGFNPQALVDPTDPENISRAGGRGMLLMRTFMDEVSYNDRGNEVTMVKRAASAVAVRSE